MLGRDLTAPYYEAQVQMLLASPNVRACLVGPSEIRECLLSGVKTVVIAERNIRQECFVLLRKSQTVQAASTSELSETSFLAYVHLRKLTADPRDSELRSMSASEFSELRGVVHHLDLQKLDLNARAFAMLPGIRHLRSLDMSRLQLDDAAVIELVSSGRVSALRWLDLSGNQRISAAAVESIAKSVHSGRMPALQWLDLLGTQCDATPYIDGRCWRITATARQLAAKYGFQPWMMLGSRIVEFANSELLTTAQQRLPPSRFTLP